MLDWIFKGNEIEYQTLRCVINIHKPFCEGNLFVIDMSKNYKWVGTKKIRIGTNAIVRVTITSFFPYPWIAKPNFTYWSHV